MLFHDAGFYERKCCRLDALTFAGSPLIRVEAGSLLVEDREVTARDLDGELRARGVTTLAIYATPGFDESSIRDLRFPSVSRFDAGSRLFRSQRHPTAIRSPNTEPPLAEAVEPDLFDWLFTLAPHGAKVVAGSLHQGAESLRMVELTFNRLSRFRDDLDWNVFDTPPTLDEIRELSVWVDVAAGADDLDGWTAEALVAGLPVVAARTPVNVARLANGDRGLLVRPGDPNEIAHAVASMLFKEEVREPRMANALATRDDFLPEHRARDWNVVLTEASR